jgi:hypothetical protein
MTINYDRKRRIYLDSETQEYMTVDQVDRDLSWYCFMLYDPKGDAIVGVEAQEYVSKFRDDEPEKAAQLQTIILNAWTPDTGNSPTNRRLLEAGDPLIDRISDFLRARRAHGSRPETPVEYEIVFDPSGEKSGKDLHRG